MTSPFGENGAANFAAAGSTDEDVHHDRQVAEPREMPVEQFARKVKELLAEEDCKLVWFLGAGASVASGAPTSEQLVRQWLPRLKAQQTGSEQGWEEWGTGVFPGFDAVAPARHYGAVMDALFPLPADRQVEVERITEGLDPSVGYALLSCDRRYCLRFGDDAAGPRVGS